MQYRYNTIRVLGILFFFKNKCNRQHLILIGDCRTDRQTATDTASNNLYMNWPLETLCSKCYTSFFSFHSTFTSSCLLHAIFFCCRIRLYYAFAAFMPPPTVAESKLTGNSEKMLVYLTLRAAARRLKTIGPVPWPDDKQPDGAVADIRRAAQQVADDCFRRANI